MKNLQREYIQIGVVNFHQARNSEFGTETILAPNSRQPWPAWPLGCLAGAGPLRLVLAKMPSTAAPGDHIPHDDIDKHLFEVLTQLYLPYLITGFGQPIRRRYSDPGPLKVGDRAAPRQGPPCAQNPGHMAGNHLSSPRPAPPEPMLKMLNTLLYGPQWQIRPSNVPGPSKSSPPSDNDASSTPIPSKARPTKPALRHVSQAQHGAGSSGSGIRQNIALEKRMKELIARARIVMAQALFTMTDPDYDDEGHPGHELGQIQKEFEHISTLRDLRNFSSSLDLNTGSGRSVRQQKGKGKQSEVQDRDMQIQGTKQSKAAPEAKPPAPPPSVPQPGPSVERDGDMGIRPSISPAELAQLLEVLAALGRPAGSLSPTSSPYSSRESGGGSTQEGGSGYTGHHYTAPRPSSPYMGALYGAAPNPPNPPLEQPRPLNFHPQVSQKSHLEMLGEEIVQRDQMVRPSLDLYLPPPHTLPNRVEDYPHAQRYWHPPTHYELSLPEFSGQNHCWLIDSQGQKVSDQRFADMQSFVNALFRVLAARGLLPRMWTGMNSRSYEFLIKWMTFACVEFRLCSESWKAAVILPYWYSQYINRSAGVTQPSMYTELPPYPK
ncbi:hypothetical protein SISNIDRAFT_468241 [Sistotremastrum niveocremeum HHB9708]|uniref:Uncharacterized protein n=1 Tax=Sistotremastrum niveocremeum HHB9708 TaxID=1314777 RepID=A0A164RNB8_9AGAM|nr:hypothetical protein SISNIDRAFT_468241 [Sistotremastrum niveocremeum HHB9708]